MNTFLFMSVYFLGIISSAMGFRCYVCNRCPYRLNLTRDSYIFKNGCSKCLVSTELEVSDQPNSNRQCLTKRIEEYFQSIGINTGTGCSNVSQIPQVTRMKQLCFCTGDLCNFSVNFTVNHFWFWLLEIVSLLFKYG